VIDISKKLMINQITWLIFSVPSLLIASTIHEFAHAFAAYKLGDYTAKIEGRMTLNPLAHIDPVGALMMVIARFGWSKPVPINEHNFDDPVAGTALSSFAGPLSNIIAAALTALPLRLLIRSNLISQQNLSTNFLSQMLIVFMLVNVSLGIFNLVPLPPLDGHKIVRALLPRKLRYYWEQLEEYSIIILILIFLPFSPLSQLLDWILTSSIELFLTIFL
jgi:Zn-dependent protease